MAPFIDVLLFALVARYSTAGSFQPVSSAIFYSLGAFLVHLASGGSIFNSLVFVTVAGLLCWVFLTLLERVEGEGLLWWPVLFVGLFSPFVALFVSLAMVG